MPAFYLFVINVVSGAIIAGEGDLFEINLNKRMTDIWYLSLSLNLSVLDTNKNSERAKLLRWMQRVSYLISSHLFHLIWTYSRVWSQLSFLYEAVYCIFTLLRDHVKTLHVSAYILGNYQACNYNTENSYTRASNIRNNILQYKYIKLW